MFEILHTNEAAEPGDGAAVRHKWAFPEHQLPQALALDTWTMHGKKCHGKEANLGPTGPHPVFVTHMRAAALL